MAQFYLTLETRIFKLRIQPIFDVVVELIRAIRKYSESVVVKEDAEGREMENLI